MVYYNMLHCETTLHSRHAIIFFLISCGQSVSWASGSDAPGRLGLFLTYVATFNNLFCKQTHCKHSLFCTTCIWSIFFGSIYRLFRSWASRSDAPGRPGFGYGCFYFVCAMKLYNEFLLLNGTVFGATFVSLPNKDLHPNCTV